ncbi:MAG: MoaD family protein [Anaerolineales bacterium]|nr:MoaD family protein [Anaerolineales bacterium]
MIKVNLKYLAPICDIAGAYRETLILDQESTMMDVIDVLCRRYGQPVHDLFYEPSGNFRPLFIMLCNTKPMVVEDLERPLNDGDTVAFVPPVAGG